MFTLKKRGKGKIKVNYGNLDLYKFYKSESKNPVTQPVFNAIIKDLNNKVRERILNESEEFKMPFRLGTLKIKKISTSLYKLPKNKWPVNYKKSKELGFIVYHEQDNTCRWKWDKKRGVFTGRRTYIFKPCRSSKRLLAHYIKVLKKDYFG